ncbi:MAG TPA: methylated-DNA--[protein]-cysteine S-methyltransferase [Candidatus Polarisedimenticolia bacterium]|nr:methylated-DNA--[protein]-cysteine S-methyltransferase [Candidatus Polarisedimenticolia bacterium]
MKRKEGTTIDVTTVRTQFAIFAVAATPKGIASIFPVESAKLTSARALRDPWLKRRVKAGSTLEIHATSRTYSPALRKATSALVAYASGKNRRLPAFDLEGGTDFQVKVWKKLCDIPHGKTLSYGQLAAAIGKPKAARAVGGAVGSNPVPILIPCHRVIGENGTLTGFGLGLPMKRALLDHEGLKLL